MLQRILAALANLAKICVEYNLERPELINTMNLCKHLATSIKLLNLKSNELDQVGCHMVSKTNSFHMLLSYNFSLNTGSLHELCLLISQYEVEHRLLQPLVNLAVLGTHQLRLL